MFRACSYRAQICKLLRSPRCSLAGWYDNPLPTRFLAPIDCLKILAQYVTWSFMREICLSRRNKPLQSKQVLMRALTRVLCNYRVAALYMRLSSGKNGTVRYLFKICLISAVLTLYTWSRHKDYFSFNNRYLSFRYESQSVPYLHRTVLYGTVHKYRTASNSLFFNICVEHKMSPQKTFD